MPALTTLAALHWQYPAAAVVVLPAVATLSAYVVWAYLPQVRQVGRRRAWVLAALRWAACVALAVSLLRPAVTRPRTPAEQGPVVFLIDDSLSMGVSDTGRTPGQRVALGAALNRLPPGARDAAAVSVASATDDLVPLTEAVARARAEVGYARLAGRDADPALARLDAAVGSLSQSARSVAGAVAAAGSIRSPRLERLLGSLATVPTGVDRETWLDRAADRSRAAAVEAAAARGEADGRLYDDDPAVRDAADAVANRTREQLAWAAAFDTQDGLLARLGPGMPVAAFAVGERVGPVPVTSQTPPPDGVASDLAGGVSSVLDRLATAGEAPRAVVLFSDGRQVNGSSPDAVAATAAGVPVDTVAVAPGGPPPNLTVTDLVVPRYAYPGEPVTCRATLRATRLADTTAELTLVAGSDSQVQRVHVGGDRAVTVSFSWTPAVVGPTAVVVRAAAVDGEATTADNTAEAWTAVVGPPLRVAVFAPTVGWSAAATCASLSAMPHVRLLSDGLNGIARADVAILFDVTARSLSPAQWESVTRLVSDRGGGVILLPPDGGFGGAPSSPLGRLLPFSGPSPLWVARRTGPYRSAGRLPPLADRPAEDARRWASLPALEGFLPLVPLRPDVRVALWAGDVPVLTERPVGAGRVLCWASDQSWRWRATPEGRRDFDRFWAALIRRAAGDPYAVEAGEIAFDADAFSVVPGQAVHLRLQLNAANPPATARLRALARGGKLIKTALFHPRGGGRFELALVGLPAGDFTLEADAGGTARLPLRVRPSATAELADLSGDDGFLRRLSNATGGQSFRLDQLDALAALLNAPPAAAARPIELLLWDGPYLYAGVLGLLTTEWALRRRAGLA